MMSITEKDARKPRRLEFDMATLEALAELKDAVNGKERAEREYAKPLQSPNAKQLAAVNLKRAKARDEAAISALRELLRESE